MEMNKIVEFMDNILASNSFERDDFVRLREFFKSIGNDFDINNKIFMGRYLELIFPTIGKNLKSLNDKTPISADAKRDFYQIVGSFTVKDFCKKEVDFLASLNISELLDNAYDTQWITKKYQESNTDGFFKYILILFKSVSDILTNESVGEAFIRRVYMKKNTYDKFRVDISRVGDRYKKYIKDEDDRDVFLMGLTQTIGGGANYNTNVTFDDDVNSFLEYSENFDLKLSKEVFKCMLSDCIDILKDNPYLPYEENRCKYISNSLLDKWGAEETPFEPISNGYIVNPIEALEENCEETVTEAVAKDSIAMDAASKKIYKAYRAYKEGEEKVDSQITKAVVGLKNVAIGDVRSEVIEGKKFSAIGLLKKLLGTVALFSFGKIKAVIFLVIRYALKKKTTDSEREKIIMELDTEIEMITEKINDARGDGNREAKYAMMRTKKELENAKKRIQYGMEASSKDLTNAKATIDASREGR